MYYKTTKIDPNWHQYDQVIATCHLDNFGVIYCDSEYHTPIDNEFELEEILKKEGE